MRAREVEIDGLVARVPLTRGMFAVIDAELAPAIGRYNWYAGVFGEIFYAARTERGRNILMHREIMGAVPGQIIDHADGDGLHNRRMNLRFATHQENMRNSVSRRVVLPKGVQRYGGGYIAVIGLDGMAYWIGSVRETPAEASAVYELFASRLFGEFYRRPEPR